jgi:hypothetical protein
MFRRRCLLELQTKRYLIPQRLAVRKEYGPWWNNYRVGQRWIVYRRRKLWKESTIIFKVVLQCIYCLSMYIMLPCRMRVCKFKRGVLEVKNTNYNIQTNGKPSIDTSSAYIGPLDLSVDVNLHLEVGLGDNVSREAHSTKSVEARWRSKPPICSRVHPDQVSTRKQIGVSER